MLAKQRAADLFGAGDFAAAAALFTGCLVTLSALAAQGDDAPEDEDAKPTSADVEELQQTGRFVEISARALRQLLGVLLARQRRGHVRRFRKGRPEHVLVAHGLARQFPTTGLAHGLHLRFKGLRLFGPVRQGRGPVVVAKGLGVQVVPELLAAGLALGHGHAPLPGALLLLRLRRRRLPASFQGFTVLGRRALLLPSDGLGPRPLLADLFYRRASIDRQRVEGVVRRDLAWQRRAHALQQHRPLPQLQQLTLVEGDLRGLSDALRRRVGARRRRVALQSRPLLAPRPLLPSRRAVRLPVARHGRRAEGLARGARRRAVLLLLRLFLLRRRGGAKGAAVLAPRGAEAPLGLRACLGHRGRSAGFAALRGLPGFFLVAAVRPWRSSQAF